ncbi:MAG: hypothetical protein ACI845_000459 [Gammaproteobacteria bacterium]|jgi:hypothetical protein
MGTNPQPAMIDEEHMQRFGLLEQNPGQFLLTYNCHYFIHLLFKLLTL